MEKGYTSLRTREHHQGVHISSPNHCYQLVHRIKENDLQLFLRTSSYNDAVTKIHESIWEHLDPLVSAMGLKYRSAVTCSHNGVPDKWFLDQVSGCSCGQHPETTQWELTPALPTDARRGPARPAGALGVNAEAKEGKTDMKLRNEVANAPEECEEYNIFPSFRFGIEPKQRRDALLRVRSHPEIQRKIAERGLRPVTCFDLRPGVQNRHNHKKEIPMIVRRSKVFVAFVTEDYGENTADAHGYNSFDEYVTAETYDDGPTIIVVKM